MHRRKTRRAPSHWGLNRRLEPQASLNPCRASSFQFPSCFCQTCNTPIRTLAGLPSVSLSDSHRWRAIAASPTTATVSSGKEIDFDNRLSGHDALDELGLGLDPAVRVAVAQLVGRELFKARLVLLQQRLSQRLDRLVDR